MKRNQSINTTTITTEHAVIIYFNKPLPYPNALYETDVKLIRAIKRECVGYYDWHETAENDSHGSFYMYGPDADKLFEAVRPVLQTIDFMKGAVAFLRYGAHIPGVETKEIVL